MIDTTESVFYAISPETSAITYVCHFCIMTSVFFSRESDANNHMDNTATQCSNYELYRKRL